MNYTSIIDEHKNEMIKIICDVVNIPSVEAPALPGHPFGENVSAALKYMLDKAERMGFQVKNLDNYAGYIEMGEGDEVIGILAHLDVVPAGDGWTTPAFQADIRGGRIYGRGTTDDKGPAINTLYAMYALKESGIKLKRRVRLILGCNEETGWRDIDYYNKVEKMPEIGFSPDGEFPICNAEKGIFHVRLFKKFASPCSATITGGDRPNVVPDKCTCLISLKAKEKALSAAEKLNLALLTAEKGNMFEITTAGIASHASKPEMGKNAIVSMLKLLSTDGILKSEQTNAVKSLLTLVTDKTDGSGMDIAYSDKVSGALTCSLDILKLDNEGIEGTLDIRCPVSFTEKQVMDNITGKAQEQGFTAELLRYQQPLHVPEDHKLIKALKEAYKTASGKDPFCYSMGGGTYARALKCAVAFGPNFPDKPDPHIHMVDEFIDIEDAVISTKIYAEAIKRLAE